MKLVDHEEDMICLDVFNNLGDNMNMDFEENMILQRWLTTGLLEAIPPERQKYVAVALEQQRLINESCSEYDMHDSQFKRISIPMVRRLMVMPELISKRRSAANANVTSLCMRPHSLAAKYSRAMHTHDLGKEAVRTAQMVENLKLEMLEFMKQFNKTSMIFLGLTLDNNGFLCFFYDWE